MDKRGLVDKILKEYDSQAQERSRIRSLGVRRSLFDLNRMTNNPNPSHGLGALRFIRSNQDLRLNNSSHKRLQTSEISIQEIPEENEKSHPSLSASIYDQQASLDQADEQPTPTKTVQKRNQNFLSSSSKNKSKHSKSRLSRSKHSLSGIDAAPTPPKKAKNPVYKLMAKKQRPRSLSVFNNQRARGGLLSFKTPSRSNLSNMYERGYENLASSLVNLTQDQVTEQHKIDREEYRRFCHANHIDEKGLGFKIKWHLTETDLNLIPGSFNWNKKKEDHFKKRRDGSKSILTYQCKSSSFSQIGFDPYLKMFVKNKNDQKRRVSFRNKEIYTKNPTFVIFSFVFRLSDFGLGRTFEEAYGWLGANLRGVEILDLDEHLPYPVRKQKALSALSGPS